jgi:phage gpG-like protein
MSFQAYVKVNDARVIRGLAKLEKAGKDMRPVFRQLKRPLIDDLKAIAASEQGPDGPWPSLSVSAARRRKKSQFPQMLGEMAHKPGNTVVSQRKQSIRARNKVGFSGMHQEGYTTPTGGKVPARPFMYFREQWLAEANKRILEHLEKGWQQE